MSINRFSLLECTNLDEYSQQLMRFNSEIAKLKREKITLIDEMKRKYKLCQYCLNNDQLTIISWGSNCENCKEEISMMPSSKH